MKRDPGIPLWYCAHGLPRGFEASVFRAQGLAPLPCKKTYTALVELAGYPAETGHDERGDLWLWMPAPLARLIPGIDLRYRVFMCARLGELAMDARERLLIELDAAARLSGYPNSGIAAVLGRCPSIVEMHESWGKVFPSGDKRYPASKYRRARL